MSVNLLDEFQQIDIDFNNLNNQQFIPLDNSNIFDGTNGEICVNISDFNNENSIGSPETSSEYISSPEYDPSSPPMFSELQDIAAVDTNLFPGLGNPFQSPFNLNQPELLVTPVSTNIGAPLPDNCFQNQQLREMLEKTPVAPSVDADITASNKKRGVLCAKKGRPKKKAKIDKEQEEQIAHLQQQRDFEARTGDISTVAKSREELLEMSSTELDEFADRLASTRPLSAAEERELKRQKRLIKNRESASKSRQKKQQLTQTLAQQVAALKSEKEILNKKLHSLENENTTLRQSLQEIVSDKTSGVSDSIKETLLNLLSIKQYGQKVNNIKKVGISMFIILFAFGLFFNASESKRYREEIPQVIPDGAMNRILMEVNEPSAVANWKQNSFLYPEEPKYYNDQYQYFSSDLNYESEMKNLLNDLELEFDQESSEIEYDQKIRNSLPQIDTVDCINNEDRTLVEEPSNSSEVKHPRLIRLHLNNNTVDQVSNLVKNCNNNVCELDLVGCFSNTELQKLQIQFPNLTVFWTQDQPEPELINPNLLEDPTQTVTEFDSHQFDQIGEENLF